MTRIRIFSLSLIIILIASFFTGIDATPALAASYSSTKLADDAAFTNVDGMSVNQIQDVLKSNDSFLKNYSEHGRTAAQIIYDAAHGHGDASDSINGIDVHNTVNPVAILAMLQKEQSLITMKTKNTDALKVAMGYACPDRGGCDSKYRGFTEQVENGAWQLRYNYERASGHGFKDFQVGQTVKIDGKKIKISNRTTAALYRYTPHNGTNFSKYFAKWNKNGALASNDGRTFKAVLSKVKVPKKTVSPGQKITFTLTYKNTGSAYWFNSGDNAVHLGTQNPQDSNNVLLGGGSRVNMRVNNIKKGKKGTFVWTITAPQTPGTYSVTVQPVAEHVSWFGPAKTITITVK